MCTLISAYEITINNCSYFHSWNHNQLMNEAQTRKEIIDKRLLEAGWNVDDRTQVIEEYSIGKQGEVEEGRAKYSSKEFSDYILLGREGKPLAVIEAKQASKNAEVGREQAKQYCLNIESEQDCDLPFCFYTNGHDIFFWDIGSYPPRRVHGFPTLDDLERLRYLRKAKSPLAEELINTITAGREYQIRAIRAVMESLERNRRKLLLVMATGTGKTRTTIALVEALMRGGWAERVLFLVDRIALKDQAIDAFKEHLPHEPYWPHKEEKEIATDRRIYVSTYPTMLNIIQQDDTSLSPHFFDLIVIDESHRSIYNTYGEILEYFDAVTVGLTATPTDVIDHNTFELFECEDGLPTFAYSYDEAVNNIPPYLCDFQVMKIKTHFQDDGINKRTITLEDQKKLMLEGKEIEDINYEGSDIEKRVISRGTNALIIQEFMEESIKDNDGVLPGKTIFFCMTKEHARRMEELFDAMYPEYKGELAKVLVSEDPRVYGKGGLLDQFKNRDMPRIAISVDMLDTGVDIREITNLVFAKPVFSYTKFWQMIGRGTRLLDEEQRKPWCTAKDTFLILDCWDNFEYFKLNPNGKTLKSQIPLPVRLFSLFVDKLSLALELERNDVVLREIDNIQTMIGWLPENSITVMEAKNEIQPVYTEDFWNELDLEAISFLREKVKPLMRTISRPDFKTLRFVRDLVRVSIAKLEGDHDQFDALTFGIRERIGELPLTVNVIAKEKKLIEEAQTARFWQEAEENEFYLLIDRIAPLMEYLDSTWVPSLGKEKLNLKDRIVSKEWLQFGPENASLRITQYREMVEKRIQELTATNPLLQKVQRGELLNDVEVNELTTLLYNEPPHITLDLLRKVYAHRKAQLFDFLKHILNIEPLEDYTETVSNLVAEFVKEHSYLNSRQLEFLQMLKNYLIERDEIDPENLAGAPFTRIHPEGILGLFSPNEIEEILTLIERAA